MGGTVSSSLRTELTALRWKRRMLKVSPNKRMQLTRSAITNGRRVPRS